MPKKVSKKIIIAAILTVALFALGLGGYYGWRNPTRRSNPINFSVVVPDKLYRSGQPRADDLRRMAKEYGIKTVVCMSADGDEGWGVRKAAQELGIKVVGIKMSETLIPGPEQSSLVLKLITGRPVKYRDYERMIQEWPGPADDPVSFPGPVLLHCYKGKDRTGYMIALYRICLQGWPVEKAGKEMREHYHRQWIWTTPQFLKAAREIKPAQSCPSIIP